LARLLLLLLLWGRAFWRVANVAVVVRVGCADLVLLLLLFLLLSRIENTEMRQFVGNFGEG
jgi:hypothetical protein